MRILVAGGFEASSHRAHAINTIKMAKGFAQLGHAVTIVCRRPATGKVPAEELDRLYGLTRGMRWIQLPSELLGRQVGEVDLLAVLGISGLVRVRPNGDGVSSVKDRVASFRVNGVERRFQSGKVRVYIGDDGDFQHGLAPVEDDIILTQMYSRAIFQFLSTCQIKDD